MRAVVIPKHGGVDVLKVVESEDPEPGEGYVRIRVRAAGLNFAEVMARAGLYPASPKPPCTVGYEGAGIIDKVGPACAEDSDNPDTANLAVGDRVMFFIRFGGHADTVIVPRYFCFKIPDKMSFEEAGSFPVVYVTAYHMINRCANIRPGESVLIHAAAGGVGLAALQILKSIPNLTIFGSSSPSKHEMLREQGCTHTIDYRSEDVFKVVKEKTGGKGVHVILDALGGDSFKKGYAILRKPGRLVCFGVANMVTEKMNIFKVMHEAMWKTPKFNPLDMMEHNKAVLGVNMLEFFDEPELMREEINELLALYNDGHIKITVDSTFKFSEAAAAHKRMLERKNVGKVLLVPDEPVEV